MSKKKTDLSRAERAAALRAQHEKAERNRKLAIGGAAALVLAVLIGLLAFSLRDTGKPTKSDFSGEVAAGEQSLVLGKASAPHKVVVYEDFLCPFCREFEEASRAKLHKAAEEGRAQVEYRPFQLLPDDYSKQALAAFAAVLEESPAKALAFHDLLFKEQPYENAANKPDAADLADWADSVGASKSEIEKAAKDGKAEWAAAAEKAAQDAGVKGTPYVTVDGEQLQGASISDMVAALEQTIAK